MREIKFRAWDKTREVMVLDPPNIFFPCNTEKSVWLFMQYTGLKDKNGKEIYEGDILNINPEDDNWHDFVVYISNRFELNSFNGNQATQVDLLMAVHKDNPAEIIGNIYENKELLCLNTK